MALCFRSGQDTITCGCAACVNRRALQMLPILSPRVISPRIIVPAKEPEVISDIEVGRHALRTFNLREGTLKSVVKDHTWDGGVAIAECLTNHPCEAPPGKGCTCGIYGTVTLGSLIKQYREQAARSVAVFAAEGETIIGSQGLRTAAARIVAYWVRDDEDAKIFAQCEGAQRFTDVGEMLAAYHFPEPEGVRLPLPTPEDFRIPMSRNQVDKVVDRMKTSGMYTPGGLAAIKYSLGFLAK